MMGPNDNSLSNNHCDHEILAHMDRNYELEYIFLLVVRKNYRVIVQLLPQIHQSDSLLERS